MSGRIQRWISPGRWLLRDAVDALYTSEDSKRRYEIIARQVSERFKVLLMEPSALRYAARHDDIEAIYKKLQERRDTADITEVLKELHRIVNQAIVASGSGGDQAASNEDELALFDLLQKPDLGKAARERVKQSSQSLLRSIEEHLKCFEDWTANEQTRADVEVFVLDHVIESLPQPPYSTEEAENLAGRIYNFVFQQAASGAGFRGSSAA